VLLLLLSCTAALVQVAADFAVATSAELQQSPQMCTASFLTKREPSDSKECQVGLWGLHTNSKHMHDVCILAAQCIVLAAIMWRTGCHLGEFALLHGRRLSLKGAVGLCGRFCLGCALTLLSAPLVPCVFFSLNFQEMKLQGTKACSSGGAQPGQVSIRTIPATPLRSGSLSGVVPR
jgi:hypothetical protein